MKAAASLLSIEETSREELGSLLALADDFLVGPTPAMGTPTSGLLVFLSDRESIRTRLAVHCAAGMLGEEAVDLDLKTAFYADPARRPDHASFVAAELASLQQLGCRALVIRTHSHAALRVWRDLSSVPIINGCSDEEHPLQALADACVIRRNFGRTEGVKLTLVGNGTSPVFRSLLFAATRLGITIKLVCPEDYGFPPDLVERAGLDPESVNTHDFAAALSHADILYADSVVYRALTATEERDFAPYRLTAAAVRNHAPSAQIMHCLPHADEIDTELVLCDRSLVLQQVAARPAVTAAAVDWLRRKTCAHH